MIDQTHLNIIHISSHGELNDNSIDDEAITASYLEDLNLEASSVAVSGEFPSVASDEMLDFLRTKKQLIILDARYSVKPPYPVVEHKAPLRRRTRPFWDLGLALLESSNGLVEG